jgi:hypothetical protein
METPHRPPFQSPPQQPLQLRTYAEVVNNRPQNIDDQITTLTTLLGEFKKPVLSAYTPKQHDSKHAHSAGKQDSLTPTKYYGLRNGTQMGSTNRKMKYNSS